MLSLYGEKSDEIVGTIKPGNVQTKLMEHIVRMIVLLKRWLLQIEQEFYMETKDIKSILASKLW